MVNGVWKGWKGKEREGLGWEREGREREERVGGMGMD